VHVSRDTWAEMKVVNHDGREKGRDFLQTVTVNGHMAYEVDDYWREGNIAVASSMAGRTDRELRQDRHDIARAKGELEAENDRMWDALVSHNDHVRDHASTVGNHLIRTVEGVRLPDGDSLFDDLQQSLEDGPDLMDKLDMDEHDPDVASDDDGDDDRQRQRDEPDAGEVLQGIFARAENAEQPAATDGGERR